MLVRTEPFSSTAADTTGSTWLRAANPIRKPCRKLKTCRGPGLVSPPITLPNGRSPSREVNEMANLKDDRGKTLDLETDCWRPAPCFHACKTSHAYSDKGTGSAEPGVFGSFA